MVVDPHKRLGSIVMISSMNDCDRADQNAAVAATTGLLAVMNREELEGVNGHEEYIRNYDIRISTIAVALPGAITDAVF